MVSTPTLTTLGDILKDVYMGGPPQPVVKRIEWWSCRKHKHPNLGVWEERCEYDPECDDWECPHRESVKVKEGCQECKTAEYVHVLDGETGAPAYEIVFRSGIAWMLERESIFLDLLLKEDCARTSYGGSSVAGSETGV